jgi:hypothetical protein
MRVQRFTRDGRAVGQLSLPGLREADADAAGDMYVVRHRYGSSDEDPTDPEVPPAGTHKIIVERLHFEGGFVSGREESSPATTVWSDSWVEPRSTGPMSQVAAVEVDSARERVYVLDAGLRKVRVYATDGTAYPEIDLPDLGAGFPEYTDLAVGSDGSVFVLHTAGRRLWRFAPDGTLLEQSMVPEASWRLDVLPNGDLAIITARRWLWILSPSREVRSVWALPRSEFDTGEAPSDVAADRHGFLYVTDRGGQAVFVFAPEGLPRRDPPPASLTCRLSATITTPPAPLALGEAVRVVLTLGGECDPHPRTGSRPDTLTHSGVFSATLPAGFAFQPPLAPGVKVIGRTVSLSLGAVPHGGVDHELVVVPHIPGRRTVFESSGGAVVDGWFGFGNFAPAVPFIMVRPADATAAPPQGLIYVPSTVAR